MMRRRRRHSNRPAACMTAVLCVALAGACDGVFGQSTAPGNGPMDYGAVGLSFPPAVVVSGHVPRTAQLLGEAYRRKDPVVANRVRLICELGQTGIAAAAPYIAEAMADPAA